MLSSYQVTTVTHVALEPLSEILLLTYIIITARRDHPFFSIDVCWPYSLIE